MSFLISSFVVISAKKAEMQKGVTLRSHLPVALAAGPGHRGRPGLGCALGQGVQILNGGRPYCVFHLFLAEAHLQVAAAEVSGDLGLKGKNRLWCFQPP